ncbi:hypothetical protein RSAG8_12613, partial [Rhizoctonia solani AG-8 WAC10335]
MPSFDLPIDPLLQQALIPRGSLPEGNSDIGAGHEGLNSEGDNPGSSDYEDDERLRPPNANKRPRLENDTESIAANVADPPLRGNPIVVAPVPTSLRQYAQSLISLKKLADNSQQELHRFTTGSPAEREAMTFALGLEIRDSPHVISEAVVSSNIHADLMTNIKTYTAAAFFSPVIRYYAPPNNSARNKDLQKSILQQLVTTGLPHIPPSSDAAGTNKVLGMIGGELTSWRSTVKDELSKRKAGEPNTDIGSFSSRLMRNTSIKVTREHYGRIAVLSREYSLWETRSQSLSKAKYWEWVDKALERVREQQKSDPEGVRRFFQDIMKEDEVKFSKAVGKAVGVHERDNWQKMVESAMGGLA